MGSSCRTCGTALPPWHRTYAHSGFYSAGRKTHCRESRLWRSLRSTYRSAARVPSASPSPCRKDAYNISKVTCLVRKNHYYHALLATITTVGVVTGLGQGQTTITATSGPISGSTVLTVVATHGFVPTGNLNIARQGHTATLLHDGKVLVVGGSSVGVLPGGELYNPAGGSVHRYHWSAGVWSWCESDRCFLPPDRADIRDAHAGHSIQFLDQSECAVAKPLAAQRKVQHDRSAYRLQPTRFCDRRASRKRPSCRCR